VNRIPLLLLSALTLFAAGCGTRTLSTEAVQQFVAAADDAARKRFAPSICAMRASKFELHQTYLIDGRGGDKREVNMNKKLFCSQAAAMARLNQYVMERGPLSIALSADRRSATVDADYVEKLPFYDDPSPGQSVDLYEDVQIVETHDHSVVGIEDGKIRFISTVAAIRVRLVPRHDMPLPYS
jgi:hypothetical protein